MAVVLDTGAVSRGSGNQGSNKERDIRKAFVEADLIEAVLLLAREPLLQHDRRRASSWSEPAASGIPARSC